MTLDRYFIKYKHYIVEIVTESSNVYLYYESLYATYYLGKADYIIISIKSMIDMKIHDINIMKIHDILYHIINILNSLR